MKTSKLNSWLFLLVLSFIPALLYAQSPPSATYYVATTGNDTTNNGTSPSTPFLTINHALGLCNGGQKIAVASGTYTSTGAHVILDGIQRASMVTVIGWGATPPLIQAPPGNYTAVYINGGSFLTFENFTFRSNNNSSPVTISCNYAMGTPLAHDITIQNCDISDPDTGDTTQNANNMSIHIGESSTNVTVQGCNIHDSEGGIGGIHGNSSNINILNNTLQNFTCDAMQFQEWNNVTITGNTIENMRDAAGSTFHNDGIQFVGNTQNCTITHNFIAHSNGQCMLIQDAVGPIDGLVVEDNVMWDCAGIAIQNNATHAVFMNNTVYAATLGGFITRAGTFAIPTDTIVANNSIESYTYSGGAVAAYEDYNCGVKNGGSLLSGPHDLFNITPGYVNPTGGNFHPATTSPLLHVGIGSFVVSGTNYSAPADDLDFITRGNPPTIGAYETTLGNTPISYCGFNYTTTGPVASMTDGAADFGWSTSTWTSGSVVSPGLTSGLLPVSGLALSYNSNIGSDRTINPASMPASYTVLGGDGVTRLGAVGTTVWLSFLVEPTVDDPTGSLVSGINLNGAATGGGTKLSIGDIGTSTSWGVKNPYSGTPVYATGAAPIATNQVALIVVSIQFVSGTNNDVVKMWVNPPIDDTPPTTPDATLTGIDVGPFGVVEFKGNRTSIGDEVSVGTTWLSVISGGQP